MITEQEATLLDAEARRLLQMYREGRYAPLLTEVDELSKGGPLSPGVLGLASLSLTALERYEEAAKAAQGALRQEPGWAWLYNALARAEEGRGRLEAAVAAQSRAVQLMPGEPGYTAALVRCHRLKGDAPLAVRTARQALVAAPEDPGLLNELGLALLETGDRDEALERFREAQEVAPEDPAAWLNEGVLHLRAGARREARRPLRQALKRRPGLWEAEDRMAETLTGETGPVRAVLLHLLTLARVTLVGWAMIAFLYYLFFRLLEFIWKLLPATLPVGRTILLVTLIWLVGGMAVGHLLRLAFRTVWPR